MNLKKKIRRRRNDHKFQRRVPETGKKLIITIDLFTSSLVGLASKFGAVRFLVVAPGRPSNRSAHQLI